MPEGQVRGSERSERAFAPPSVTTRQQQLAALAPLTPQGCFLRGVRPAGTFSHEREKEKLFLVALTRSMRNGTGDRAPAGALHQ